MRRIRSTSLLLCVAVAASVLSSQAAAAGPEFGTGRCSSVITLRTLHIEAVPSKKTVRPGESFKVDVTVTRPAHEDPLGQGIEFEPPVSVPAEGVTVWIAVWVGEYTYFWDVGVTDENGKDTLTLDVPADSEHGWALAAAVARYWVNQSCPDILEEGDTYYPKFVKVVP